MAKACLYQKKDCMGWSSVLHRVLRQHMILPKFSKKFRVLVHKGRGGLVPPLDCAWFEIQRKDGRER